MEYMLGKSYRHLLENNRYVDISIFPNKWRTKVSMSLWEEGNGVSLKFVDQTFLNFDKFLPNKLAVIIATFKINRQSQKVAGFDLIRRDEGEGDGYGVNE